MTQALKKTPPAVDTTAMPAERKLPECDSKSVQINVEGFAYRQFMIRLPDGLIADDLKEPKIWRKVQSEPQSALLKHDHLYLVSHDESWAADAIVTHASGSEVVLSKPRLITFAERTKPFFRDEKYTVAWCGKGYGVKRLSDDQLMTNIVTSEAIAERDLANLYPKPIG